MKIIRNPSAGGAPVDDQVNYLSLQGFAPTKYVEIDMDAGEFHEIDADDNFELRLINKPDGNTRKHFEIRVTQNGGPHTMTFEGGSFKKPDNVEVGLTVESGAIDTMYGAWQGAFMVLNTVKDEQLVP